MNTVDAPTHGKDSPAVSEAAGISVVIPTHGRVRLLRQLLESLEAARQRYAGESEILVIDSSFGQERQEIERLCTVFGSTIEHMPNNVRMKRNWGITHAQYPIVLFIDSDCIADVSLLEEHAKLYGQNDPANLGGVVGLTRFVGAENWVWRVIQRSSTLDAFSYPEHHRVVLWGPTCNMSYRRDVVEEVGLFDTSFPFALGGDDTDLGLRVTDAGYLLLTNAHAVVEHEKETWSSISAIVRRRFRWGRMHFYIMRKHAHRVSCDPPTVPGEFLLLLLLFLPLGMVRGFVAWATLPFLWLLLELCLEALLIGHQPRRQPAEFLYTLGACLLALIFEAGTTLEGIRNRNMAPLFKDVNYCPPSPQGRQRGILRLWARAVALPLSIWLILLLQLAVRIL